MPRSYFPLDHFAPFWDDLRPDLGCGSLVNSVLTATVGAAPDRKFVVQWTSVQHNALPDAEKLGTFQLWLSEGSGEVVFKYVELGGSRAARGASASVGMRSWAKQWGYSVR